MKVINSKVDEVKGCIEFLQIASCKHNRTFTLSKECDIKLSYKS